MVKSALQKNSFREIFRSPGRYFAILGIILLGAGFFTYAQIQKVSSGSRNGGLCYKAHFC